MAKLTVSVDVFVSKQSEIENFISNNMNFYQSVIHNIPEGEPKENYYYLGLINVNGETTKHFIRADDVGNEAEAAMIMLADALQFEPSELLNLDCFLE